MIEVLRFEILGFLGTYGYTCYKNLHFLAVLVSPQSLLTSQVLRPERLTGMQIPQTAVARLQEVP